MNAITEPIALPAKEIVRIETPEQTKVQGLVKLFGAEFATAYSLTSPVDTQEFIKTPAGEFRSLMLQGLAEDLRLEQIPEGKIRILRLLENDRKETRVFAVLEHGITNDHSSLNPDARVIEIFDLGLSKQIGTTLDSTYDVRDVFWSNNNGELESFKASNELDDARIMIKFGQNTIDAKISAAAIVTSLPTSEERIAGIHHEAGHFKFNKINGGREKFIGARERIRTLLRKLEAQASVNFAGRTRVEEFSEDLDLLISDEQNASSIGNENAERTIKRGFKIISGDYKNKLRVFADKWLTTYQETFQKICELLGKNFFSS